MARLRIADPCPVSLSSMEPTAAGHSCGTCRKQVVDLGRMDERDAYVLVAMSRPGSLCASFPTRDGQPVFRRGSAALIAAAFAAGCSGSPAPARPAEPIAEVGTESRAAADPHDRDGDGIADHRDRCP